MSIASEITRLQGIKGDIRNALIARDIAAGNHNFADFATDIGDIIGGAELNVIAVSSSSSLPSSAEDGTIAIITSATIKTVTVDGTPPNSPISGDVFIRLSTSTTNTRLSISENIYLNLRYVSVYDGAAWVKCTYYVMVNGIWVVNRWYWLETGVGFNAEKTSEGGDANTMVGSNAYYRVRGGVNNPAKVITTNMVNLSAYSIMYADVYKENGNNNGDYKFGICDTRSGASSGSVISSKSPALSDLEAGGRKTYSLSLPIDVENCYIFFESVYHYTYGTSFMRFYNIWFE